MICSITGTLLALASRERNFIDFAMACNAGGGLLSAIMQIENGQNYILWNIVAIVSALAMMTYANRFTGHNPKEARLWKKLFGNTIWQLLWNDERLKTWRKQ